MGERVAHMVTGNMIDYIEFEDGFAIARTKAPRESFDQTLGSRSFAASTASPSLASSGATRTSLTPGETSIRQG